jgi:cytochrome c oxidase cbb3-type subunit 4
MNYGLYHSIGTVSAFVAFLAVCWWAYSPGNRERFREDGNLPLDTDPIHIAKKQEQELREKSE